MGCMYNITRIRGLGGFRSRTENLPALIGKRRKGNEDLAGLIKCTINYVVYLSIYQFVSQSVNQSIKSIQ